MSTRLRRAIADAAMSDHDYAREEQARFVARGSGLEAADRRRNEREWRSAQQQGELAEPNDLRSLIAEYERDLKRTERDIERDERELQRRLDAGQVDAVVMMAIADMIGCSIRIANLYRDAIARLTLVLARLEGRVVEVTGETIEEGRAA